MVSANTIDISEFQDPSAFDYQAAKNAGINTIIIRGSVSMRLDEHAKEHIANAKKYGFHWHLYHYYYGGSGEADFAVQAAQELGLSSSQYLFLDMEDKSLPNDWATSFEIFREKAQSHFKVGLYCSDSPYQAKFNDSTLKQEGVARWVASYSYEPKNYDIWQMSGAGSGGFGTYTGDVDRDYDKAGVLTSNSSSDQPKTPTGPANPGYRAIILEDGIDTDAGIYGRGCSYDNGKTFKVYWTPYGRKYYQEDADHLYPFFKKYLGIRQVPWSSITDKPDLALKSDIPSTIDWSKVTNKPDLGQPKIDTSAQTTNKLPSDYSDGIFYEVKTVSVLGIDRSGLDTSYQQGSVALVTVKKFGTYARQTAEVMDSSRPETFVRNGSGSSWYSWEVGTTW